eukprot:gnl/TRDRNA2_/TRDRNA2_49360_c0_seq1.p1 gnl/TRDRNA2_/TRDRNA2_49360_c0~~gnl/TRDRNA2_/TRDRNA2_49360_c0_seq1.p1  ORF type:complete len:345 (+),score=58.64 gnl/TRDRNA2_/TRDRNA2_49360_c0_seq1:57-1091(+)
MAFMNGGVIQLAAEGAFEALRTATIGDCITWAEAGKQITGATKTKLDTVDVIANLGTAHCPVFAALHPFGRLSSADADPELPENWNVVGYEILAREVGGGDAFPFQMYAKMTKEQRVQWTVKCALLSAELKAQNIIAKFNVQDCDSDMVNKHLQQQNLSLSALPFELAEFDENDEGCIGLPACKARRLDEALLDKYCGASLDDCCQGPDDAPRSLKATLDLVIAQDARLKSGALVEQAFHTIKIDSEPACAAFSHTNLNPRAPAPTEEFCVTTAAELDAFVRQVWEISPSMCFIVEATVTTKEELQRVPSLNPSDARVSFQGCHLRASALLVTCENLHTACADE